MAITPGETWGIIDSVRDISENGWVTDDQESEDTPQSTLIREDNQSYKQSPALPSLIFSTVRIIYCSLYSIGTSELGDSNPCRHQAE